MPQEKWQSLTAMFFDQARRYAEKPLVHTKQDGGWASRTWQEISDDVVRLAAALEKLDVQPGDRVVIISENRPEWLIADLAIMAIGAITVPAYATNTSNDHLHILEDSGAKAAIISTKALARTFLKAAHQSDDLCHAIIMEPYSLGQNINVDLHQWHSVIADEALDAAPYRARASHVKKDEIACLIYTSGTGGAPKGVMLHHGSILHNCWGAAKILAPLGLKNNHFLSFLPLSHAYEHTAGQCLPLCLAAEIWYAEGLEKLSANMIETRPTVMVVVPRLFELLRTRISRAVEKEGGTKARLFNRALELGMKRDRDKLPLTLKEKLEDAFLILTVRRSVRKKFGGRMKALVSGGAPLAPEVGYFFSALGLPLLQGYGQTEAGPVISVNPPGAPRLHTVGKPFEDVTVKIAEDGEILVRGELVMKGYWDDEKATKRALQDGWLHTGDIGVLDSDGYLEITDRKKDLIVNDKGDNVSPQRIEGMLALENEIAQAMVYGDRRPYLVGLLMPDTEWMAEWATENGKNADYDSLKDDPGFKKAITKAVDRVNQRLSNIEKVRRFALATEPFSIQNEQMTPTLKLRRHVVKEHYEDTFSSLY